MPMMAITTSSSTSVNAFGRLRFMIDLPERGWKFRSRSNFAAAGQIGREIGGCFVMDRVRFRAGRNSDPHGGRVDSTSTGGRYTPSFTLVFRIGGTAGNSAPHASLRQMNRLQPPMLGLAAQARWRSVDFVQTPNNAKAMHMTTSTVTKTSPHRRRAGAMPRWMQPDVVFYYVVHGDGCTFVGRSAVRTTTKSAPIAAQSVRVVWSVSISFGLTCLSETRMASFRPRGRPASKLQAARSRKDYLLFFSVAGRLGDPLTANGL